MLNAYLLKMWSSGPVLPTNAVIVRRLLS